MDQNFEIRKQLKTTVEQTAPDVAKKYEKLMESINDPLLSGNKELEDAKNFLEDAGRGFLDELQGADEDRRKELVDSFKSNLDHIETQIGETLSQSEKEKKLQETQREVNAIKEGILKISKSKKLSSDELVKFFDRLSNLNTDNEKLKQEINDGLAALRSELISLETANLIDLVKSELKGFEGLYKIIELPDGSMHIVDEPLLKGKEYKYQTDDYFYISFDGEGEFGPRLTFPNGTESLTPAQLESANAIFGKFSAAYLSLTSLKVRFELAIGKALVKIEKKPEIALYHKANIEWLEKGNLKEASHLYQDFITNDALSDYVPGNSLQLDLQLAKARERLKTLAMQDVAEAHARLNSVSESIDKFYNKPENEKLEGLSHFEAVEYIDAQKFALKEIARLIEEDDSVLTFDDALAKLEEMSLNDQAPYMLEHASGALIPDPTAEKEWGYVNPKTGKGRGIYFFISKFGTAGRTVDGTNVSPGNYREYLDVVRSYSDETVSPKLAKNADYYKDHGLYDLGEKLMDENFSSLYQRFSVGPFEREQFFRDHKDDKEVRERASDALEYLIEKGELEVSSLDEVSQQFDFITSRILEGYWIKKMREHITEMAKARKDRADWRSIRGESSESEIMSLSEAREWLEYNDDYLQVDRSWYEFWEMTSQEWDHFKDNIVGELAVIGASAGVGGLAGRMTLTTLGRRFLLETVEKTTLRQSIEKAAYETVMEAIKRSGFSLSREGLRQYGKSLAVRSASFGVENAVFTLSHALGSAIKDGKFPEEGLHKQFLDSLYVLGTLKAVNKVVGKFTKDLGVLRRGANNVVADTAALTGGQLVYNEVLGERSLDNREIAPLVFNSAVTSFGLRAGFGALGWAMGSKELAAQESTKAFERRLEIIKREAERSRQVEIAEKQLKEDIVLSPDRSDFTFKHPSALKKKLLLGWAAFTTGLGLNEALADSRMSAKWETTTIADRLDRTFKAEAKDFENGGKISFSLKEFDKMDSGSNSSDMLLLRLENIAREGEKPEVVASNDTFAGIEVGSHGSVRDANTVLRGDTSLKEVLKDIFTNDNYDDVEKLFTVFTKWGNEKNENNVENVRLLKDFYSKVPVVLKPFFRVILVKEGDIQTPYAVIDQKGLNDWVKAQVKEGNTLLSELTNDGKDKYPLLATLKEIELFQGNILEDIPLLEAFDLDYYRRLATDSERKEFLMLWLMLSMGIGITARGVGPRISGREREKNRWHDIALKLLAPITYGTSYVLSRSRLKDFKQLDVAERFKEPPKLADILQETDIIREIRQFTGAEQLEAEIMPKLRDHYTKTASELQNVNLEDSAKNLALFKFSMISKYVAEFKEAYVKKYLQEAEKIDTAERRLAEIDEEMQTLVDPVMKDRHYQESLRLGKEILEAEKFIDFKVNGKNFAELLESRFNSYRIAKTREFFKGGFWSSKAFLEKKEGGESAVDRLARSMMIVLDSMGLTPPPKADLSKTKLARAKDLVVNTPKVVVDSIKNTVRKAPLVFKKGINAHIKRINRLRSIPEGERTPKQVAQLAESEVFLNTYLTTLDYASADRVAVEKVLRGKLKEIRQILLKYPNFDKVRRELQIDRGILKASRNAYKNNIKMVEAIEKIPDSSRSEVQNDKLARAKAEVQFINDLATDYAAKYKWCNSLIDGVKRITEGMSDSIPTRVWKSAVGGGILALAFNTLGLSIGQNFDPTIEQDDSRNVPTYPGDPDESGKTYDKRKEKEKLKDRVKDAHEQLKNSPKVDKDVDRFKIEDLENLKNGTQLPKEPEIQIPLIQPGPVEMKMKQQEKFEVDKNFDKQIQSNFMNDFQIERLTEAQAQQMDILVKSFRGALLKTSNPGLAVKVYNQLFRAAEKNSAPEILTKRELSELFSVTFLLLDELKSSFSSKEDLIKFFKDIGEMAKNSKLFTYMSQNFKAIAPQEIALSVKDSSPLVQIARQHGFLSFDSFVDKFFKVNSDKVKSLLSDAFKKNSSLSFRLESIASAILSADSKDLNKAARIFSRPLKLNQTSTEQKKIKTIDIDKLLDDTSTHAERKARKYEPVSEERRKVNDFMDKLLE